MTRYINRIKENNNNSNKSALLCFVVLLHMKSIFALLRHPGNIINIAVVVVFIIKTNIKTKIKKEVSGK